MLPVAARPLWGPCLRLQGAALRLARQQEPRVCTVRLMRCGSRRMGEALAGAPLDSAPKEYPPKIQQLVQDIASLTLLEISDLNELLKKTLKIQDVGLMPMGGTMPGAAPAAAAPPEEAEEDIPTQKEQTHFTVRLTEAKPVDKVKLIKEVKNYIQGINLVQVSSVCCTGLSLLFLPREWYWDWSLLGQLGYGHPGPLSDFALWQAKKLVESLPQEIKANVAKAEAEKIKAALEAVGGTVVLE
ncbi:39S ribosomal protein L12, mitochondrial isoform X1 [Ursus arctos]|uniref:39S ribosomal protein L12, mitochondrial isoform X1 n=1 Tax=Ursus arctos TaxID=9644 RepID=UPI0025492369|nr:39S ribosomal protein L12, mitochondrial isoform X1 [Ursus arctos]